MIKLSLGMFQIYLSAHQ